jgi:DNA-directed RNA polymerase specialized sigma24 family protein
MTKKTEITRKNFDRLLMWLHQDKEIAAQKYMSIYRRLIYVFSARGAFPAEELADRVMDVALQKVDYLIKEYKGDPLPYFHSIAKKILLEHLRRPASEQFEEGAVQRVVSVHREDDRLEVYLGCLDECLESLPIKQRKLFVEYFQYDGQEKIDHHKKLARGHRLDIKALRTKVYRIKTSLEKSIEKCVRKKNL